MGSVNNAAAPFTVSKKMADRRAAARQLEANLASSLEQLDFGLPSPGAEWRESGGSDEQ
jgi:hypothetical protein